MKVEDRAELTKEQAIALAETGFWKELSQREIAEFQMSNKLLCMPYNVFHEAIEKTLGRTVYTHEFGLNRQGIYDELFNGKPAPSLEDIINMIPEDKRSGVLTDLEWRNIMLADMQWIKDADSLRVYGKRFKKELAGNQFADELREAYRKRMAELEKTNG
jgi:hypothetical protein